METNSFGWQGMEIQDSSENSKEDYRVFSVEAAMSLAEMKGPSP